MNEPRQTQNQTMSIDDEAIFDVKSAANFLGYIVRSTKRHRKLVWATFALTFALVVALTCVMDRTYQIDIHILTHKAQMMQALVHPDRSVPPSADTPTAGAVELIRSRENLENLIEDVNLPQICDAKRSAVMRWKDIVFAKIFGPPNATDVHEAYLKLLEDRITPSVENDLVIMQIQWTDPDIAMTLAEGAVARFLKMRHDMELSEILETVNILGRNVETSRNGIEEVVKRMQKIFEDRESDLAVRSGQIPREHIKKAHIKKSRFIAIRKPVSAAQVDAGVNTSGDAKKELAAKQVEIAQIKRVYDTRLKKAQEDLTNLSASLGPDHPDVVEAKRNLESLSSPPPEMVALQAEETRLAAQIAAAPAQGDSQQGTDKAKVNLAGAGDAADDSTGYDVMRVPVSEDLYKELDKDPEIVQILDEVKKRQDAHDDLVRRLAAARIESETANVAFEYRYKLTEPPVYPKTPVKPKVPVMLAGGAVAAVFLGIFFAVVASVWSKLILESWQIERFLNIRVLGEIDEP